MKIDCLFQLGFDQARRPAFDKCSSLVCIYPSFEGQNGFLISSLWSIGITVFWYVLWPNPASYFFGAVTETVGFFACFDDVVMLYQPVAGADHQADLF